MKKSRLLGALCTCILVSLSTPVCAAPITLTFDVTNINGYDANLYGSDYIWTSDGNSPFTDTVTVIFDDGVSSTYDSGVQTSGTNQYRRTDTYFNNSSVDLTSSVESLLRGTDPSRTYNGDSSSAYNDQLYNTSGYNRNDRTLYESSYNYDYSTTTTSPGNYTNDVQYWGYVSRIDGGLSSGLTSLGDPDFVDLQQFLSGFYGTTFTYLEQYYDQGYKQTYINNTFDSSTYTSIVGKRYTGSATLTMINGQDAGTYIANLSTVPIPPALWLFGSGLLGLIGVSRRRKSI